MPTLAGGEGYACTNPANGARCLAETVYDSGGEVTGAWILVWREIDGVKALETALHELFHLQGANHSTDPRSISFPNSGLLYVTECDATWAGRFAIGTREDYRGDPCWGQVCRGMQHPLLPPCYWGSLPNGWCYPDPRYKDPSGNFSWNDGPVGGITSPSTIGQNGAITLASKDLDGRVMRVDWYINDQFVYTSIDDPFELPYSGVAPGTYKVQAQMRDDLGGAAWTTPVWLTVQASGGGGGGSSVLASGDELLVDQDRWSPNALYRLVYQGDGNLVLYGPSGPVWDSGTFGPPNRLAMQGDGNLVIYDASWYPVWASGTYSPGAWMAVSDGGFVVVYSTSGDAVWCSCW